MSSAYVPPSKRGNNAKAAAAIKPSDFPQLSSAVPRSFFAHANSFASLATEWNDQAEEDKMANEYRVASNKREAERSERDKRNVVAYHRMEEVQQKTLMPLLMP